MAVLFPLCIDQLGLGLHHQHGECVGADLHVLDVMELGAHRLGDIMTVIAVFDDNSTSDLFLVTVSLECDINLNSEISMLEEITMIETQLTPTLIAAQRRGHEQRAEVFASLFRSVPRALTGRRRR